MIHKHKWSQTITVYLRKDKIMKGEPIENIPYQKYNLGNKGKIKITISERF